MFFQIYNVLRVLQALPALPAVQDSGVALSVEYEFQREKILMKTKRMGENGIYSLWKQLKMESNASNM